MTWNIEGLFRNIFGLKHFISIHSPDLIFISEPQIYQNDVNMAMLHLQGEYNFALNSADSFDPELPLIKPKATGGTMVMWKHCHDPFISVHPTSSPAILPVIFSPPDSPLSVHVSIYLPTHGQESKFLEDLSTLHVCLDELLELYPQAPIFIRGDFNVNVKNTKRSDLLNIFCKDFELKESILHHKTYHHFTGNGRSDSNLDKLLYSEALEIPESVQKINCKMEDPAIDSHHDMIISAFHLPKTPDAEASVDSIVAPKVENNCMKEFWSDEGIEEYQNIVVPELLRIHELWFPSATHSKTSLSLLFESTNKILTATAIDTNKSVKLAHRSSPRSKPTPPKIRKSANQLLKKHRCLRQAEQRSSTDVEQLRSVYLSARAEHRKLVRENKASEAIARDSSISNILSKDPGSLFKKIKSAKKGKAADIQKLSVGNKTYLGESVPDGFFDSISNLKVSDPDELQNPRVFMDFSSDYQNILRVCENGLKIPKISEKDSFDILMKMKADVNDFFGLTPNHYIYAGPAGWSHFHFLLSILIDNVNNTDIEEVNTVYACILFKGHGKEKTSDRSYRTISTCPVTAKALDLYVRDTNIEAWNHHQPDCQFQGEGSSHELASLLITECIQHSLYQLKQPLYVLFLDAMSAFDVVLRELLVKNLYFCGTSGETLLYVNKRLENRQTFLDWNGQMMGPILDERGLEQGGVSSSDFYKIFSKEQLLSAQESGLGVPLGPLSISAVGQADDTALVSNNIHNLSFLLHLTSIFCAKYQVRLCSDKTKLQVYHKKELQATVDYWKHVNPIKVNDVQINFTETAEHVGVVRSVAGNHPSLLARISAHKKALGAVLHTGMSRAHRGNPAASLRIQQMYANSVLFSGIGSLVLSDIEANVVAQHHKETTSNLQRLLPLTPRAVIYFLAGTLPGEAFLHLRQLSIFGMITRLPTNILNSHAKNIFSFISTSPSSWFHQIRNLCLKYDLPHPSSFLSSPPSKEAYKSQIKKHVVNYWEQNLRHEASPLPSLHYFKPSFMSLTSTHPLWKTAASSPTKVVMATVQARFLSGRYRTEALCSHWSSNKMGLCKLSPTCQTPEDTSHILQKCVALDGTREKLIAFTNLYCTSHSVIADIVAKYCRMECRLFVQFLLDCSVLPEVIAAVQIHGQEILSHLFNISRQWVYSLHRDRLKLLGRWRNFAMC